MLMYALPGGLSAESRMIGDVKVTVTTTAGSVTVLIFKADSSATILTSYLSSVTFCWKNNQKHL